MSSKLLKLYVSIFEGRGFTRKQAICKAIVRLAHDLKADSDYCKLHDC